MKSLFPLSLLLCLSIVACSNNSADESSDDSHNREKPVVTKSADGVSTLTLTMGLKKAQQFYETDYENFGSKVYVNREVSIQWPEVVGKYDLTPLRDSIVMFAFGDSTLGQDIDKGMVNFINNTGDFGVDEGSKITKISVFPDDTYPWDQTVTGSLIEVTDSLLTYNIAHVYYSGGAHGIWGTYPFTYLFNEKKILTNDMLFKPNSTIDIAELIREAYLRDNNLTGRDLQDYGITFPDYYLGQPYVQDGQICFHYGVYEIGPYAVGEIDVKLYPDQLTNYLTPLGKKVLGI